MDGHSGRWPWGSGDDPYQRYPQTFLDRITDLRKSGWKETPENIKKEFGLNSTDYRTLKTIAINSITQDKISQVKKLYDSKHGPTEISRRTGIPETTVRDYLKITQDSKVYQATNTANFLKEQLKTKKMVDIGADVENEIFNGISREKLNTALYILGKEGYHVYKVDVPQPTNKDQKTLMKVLTVPEIVGKNGKNPPDVYDYDKIKSIKDYISKDGGQTFEKRFTYPTSMDSKRMLVRYANDKGSDGFTGLDKDGIVELRRGVPDLSLGNSRYAQVRILVDNTHYIKGMAIYSDNMPKGVDVIFNTNKTREKCPNKLDVLKEIKKDPDNPFGSAIKDAEIGGQYWYVDKKSGKKKLGLINKRADEGDWTDWKDALPSQFLSKQSKEMAKKQLNLAKVNSEAEFSDIMSLNNPTVKKYYLEKFADKCDRAAVDLKAASLPGQKYHVIIPINVMGEDKIYAPKYKDGTKLALIRYPHGGTFEIPILTVDNKNPKARKILPTDATDAVGISKKVADRLSGADFDGDTVMCIPTHDRFGRVKISSKNELKGLKGFDSKIYQYDQDPKIDSKGNKHYYRYGKEFTIMKNTNMEMGKISNLITDMTLGGATDDELARAVRHSMVVIDAEKHKLDYKQSEKDNGIAGLKRKYQIKVDKNGNITGYGGASTIISKSKREKQVTKRKGEPRINQEGKPWYDSKKPLGSLIYKNAPDTELYYPVGAYDKKTGKRTLTTTSGKKIEYDIRNKKEREKYDPIMKRDSKGNIYFSNKDGTITYRRKTRQSKTTEMGDTDDAYTLISSKRHPMEIIYADYANSMKSLANRARMELIRTGNLEYSKTAAKAYAKEVSSLEAKLNEARKNRPKERMATRLAASEIKRKKNQNPELKGEELRKVSQRAITKYREDVGSVSRSKRNIKIEPKEWEAIQAGAISNNKLKMILDNSDPDILRNYSMPKQGKSPTSAQVARMKALANSNFTIGEIAEKMRCFSFNSFEIFKRRNLICFC